MQLSTREGALCQSARHCNRSCQTAQTKHAGYETEYRMAFVPMPIGLCFRSPRDFGLLCRAHAGSARAMLRIAAQPRSDGEKHLARNRWNLQKSRFGSDAFLLILELAPLLVSYLPISFENDESCSSSLLCICISL